MNDLYYYNKINKIGLPKCKKNIKFKYTSLIISGTN